MAQRASRKGLSEVPGGVTAPCGFSAGVACCGLKGAGPDLALIATMAPASAAGVFTTNVVQAAPVLVSKDRVGRERVRGIVVNSGNANACTGQRGYRNAVRMADLAADALGAPRGAVLVCSTGVIGRQLPMVKVASGIKRAAAALSPDAGEEAARAIMTTDTRPKSVAVELELNGRPVRVGGMAKGSGMIAPSMATMLAFITTDAQVASGVLQSCLQSAVGRSFHRVTVDGDTSTNDCVLALANGQAEAGAIGARRGIARFQAALDHVCERLALEIARDGEGASRLIEVRVEGAASEREALRIARTIAESPLVKTAIAGGDPNWGRVLAAAGRAGVRFQPELVELWLGGVRVVRQGAACAYREAAARGAVTAPEVLIRLNLNAGPHGVSMWTCDLTTEYVRINADYTT